MLITFFVFIHNYAQLLCQFKPHFHLIMGLNIFSKIYNIFRNFVKELLLEVENTIIDPLLRFRMFQKVYFFEKSINKIIILHFILFKKSILILISFEFKVIWQF